MKARPAKFRPHFVSEFAGKMNSISVEKVALGQWHAIIGTRSKFIETLEKQLEVSPPFHVLKELAC
jgi:hypothetical protein